ncbi:dihydroneopterin aldolase [Pedobacter sp. UYP30]|uniref:dihydroneopterin aldolase n=1 Tax=Pedobacter sp. UYP30 TaxID=1756400 RepID=UPI003391C931
MKNACIRNMNERLLNNCLQTVALRDVKVFAYHGYYPEEQVLGCYFVVDLEVDFPPQTFADELSSTVNYEELNTIILSEMANIQKLLETVLNRILTRVIKKYAFISTASVSIKKLNPLMHGQLGHSFVRLNYSLKK